MSKHKRSHYQSKASRINGAQSQGPTTPAGRLKVAQNAIKHGLTAKSVVLHNEDKAAFNELLESLRECHEPANDAEFLLVEEMTVHQWRIRRVWAIQTAQFDLQMGRDMKFIDDTFNNIDEATRMAVAEEHLAENPAEERLRRHEDRLSRLYNRAAKRLETLQDRRRKLEPIQNKPQPQNTQNKPEPAPRPPEKIPSKPVLMETNSKKGEKQCAGPSAKSKLDNLRSS